MTATAERAVLVLRYGLLAAAIGCIAAGLVRNEQLAVLHKAVRICLECIGIG